MIRDQSEDIHRDILVKDNSDVHSSNLSIDNTAADLGLQKGKSTVRL